MWARLGSNTLANVLTGGTSILFQLGLTALAARSFDTQGFAVWTLTLSMASLAPLFAFNLSTVVTRRLVPVLNAQDTREAATMLKASRRISLALAVLALVTILASGLGLHALSPNLAGTGIITFLLALTLTTLGQSWQITIQPEQAWHYAREQNWPVAGALLRIRVTALLAMGLATFFMPGNLIAAAMCFAAGHWVGVLLASSGSFRPDLPPRLGAQDLHLHRHHTETARLLRWFAVWSLGMAAIQYGLPPLMSILHAQHYNAFYVAYTLNLALSGVVMAIGSAMLAPITRFASTGDNRSMGQALTWVPVLVAVGLLFALLALQSGMPLLVHYWVGSIAGPAEINAYLSLLGFQTLARSLSNVYGIVLASHATALRLVMPPLLELAIALIVALPLGYLLGEQAFLLALAGAGAVAALCTVLVGVRASGLPKREAQRLFMRFVATEVAALGLWAWMAQ